jgi:4-amino-4-deoxy-L-arabinose transferase-like glycosyltransferase
VVGGAAVVGLGLRLAWVAYAAHTPVGLYDPARYLYAAEGIARGKGYIGIVGSQPSAYYPPGYPYFLGGVAWLVRIGLPGGVPVVAGVLQALLGTSVVVSAAIVARRVWSRAAAGLAAWLVALEPNLIFHTAALLSETLFLALFMASLAVLCLGPTSRCLTTRRVIWFTVLFALAFLVRPVSIPALLAVMIGWWLATRSWRSVLRWTAIAVAALVLFTVPWTIRNAVRMHAFIPMSTNTGDNLCIGHEPDALGGFSLHSTCDVEPSLNVHNLEEASRIEVEHDEQARKLAWHYLSGNLDREPWLMWRRAANAFDSDHDGLDAVQSYCTPGALPGICWPGAWRIDPGTYSALARTADWYWYVLGSAGALGLVLLLAGRRVDRSLRRRRADQVMVALAAIGSIVVLFAFFGDARFKVPAVPLLCVSAAALACWTVERLSPGTRRPDPLPQAHPRPG